MWIIMYQNLSWAFLDTIKKIILSQNIQLNIDTFLWSNW